MRNFARKIFTKRDRTKGLLYLLKGEGGKTRLFLEAIQKTKIDH